MKRGWLVRAAADVLQDLAFENGGTFLVGGPKETWHARDLAADCPGFYLGAVALNADLVLFTLTTRHGRASVEYHSQGTPRQMYPGDPVGTDDLIIEELTTYTNLIEALARQKEARYERDNNSGNR